MNADDRTLLELAVIGAGIALGKLLAGGEVMTWRLLVGRVIIGAGLSLAAGAVLAMIPDLPVLALVGMGSALGIAGQSCLEHFIRRWLDQPRPPSREE